eukprot:scaffold470_cov276-Chaetoceros_neogracile.AAC.11
MDSAIKAANKILKKADGTIKIKELAKSVADKLDGKSSTEQIKDWILASDKFSMDGKLVSLVKSCTKRKSDDVDDAKATKKAAKKAKKEAKKRKKEGSGSSAIGGETTDSTSFTDATKWRKEQKIVLKSTSDDEDGRKLSGELNKNEAYIPYTTFESDRIKTSVHEAFLKQCTVVNKFTTPSAIQSQCWPVLLHPGSDGKRNKRRTPRMLVLAPTRELAMQSHVVIEEFGALVNLKSLVVYGGVPKYPQINDLKKGVDCVVATPGRIKDLINEGNCDLSKVSQLILDEADRMLDMGFEEDVRYIIAQCVDKDKGRQTAMFSATWPAAIQKIALEYMINPVRVYVGFETIVGSNGEGIMDDALSANKRVTQTVEVIEDRAREARLLALLKKHAKNHSKKTPYRVLIFALYKKEAARLEGNLARAGYSGLVNSIHGDKAQDARTKALKQFKDGDCPLLVATDVAARGLDIPNVELVINFTFPLTIEDYVHRIGRTGRAGKTGMSYTFFQPENKSHAGELQQVMKQAGQPVEDSLLKFGSTIKKKEHKLYGSFGPKGGPMKKAVKITFDSDDE